MWISKQEKDLMELLIRDSDIPIYFSGPVGNILWANQAFEEFIGYTLWELTSGSSGKGIAGEKLTVSGESLDADKEMNRQCISGERYKYTIKTQYIPKNDKPVWVELNVIRYPVVNELQCFIVIVSPLKNGTQTAFNLCMDRVKEFSEELRKVKQGVEEMEKEIVGGVKDALQVQTETEQIFSAIARLINRNPRVSAGVTMVIMVMILGTQLVQAIETVKKLMGW